MADDRVANVLGAFALALVDGMDVATERAALVALSDLLEGRSVDDLRRAVGLTHSGGVRVVDRLVAGGLVERRRAADGRAVALFLTPEGRRQAAQSRDARLATLHAVLGALDKREQAQLAGILDKLVAAVVGRRIEARAAGVLPPGGWLCRLCDPVACERTEGHCPALNAARAAF
jgi:MarR family transcriptional regulator, negative regulator of the multidrug operon emrRAB